MKGYFSLVQYCPDFARREAANVGVVLLCPETGFLEVKLKTANHRVRRFFGEEADDYHFLNQMKVALEERIRTEGRGLVSPDALSHFISAWANKLTLTPLKPIKVLSPEDDLIALYKELVEDPVRNLTVRAALPLRERLDAVLTAPKFDRLVRKEIRVDVPVMGRSLEAPYGYQNGRFNLIVPREFNLKSAARIEDVACRLAVEGRSLYEHKDAMLGPLQLLVVAEFATDGDKIRRRVADIFEDNRVRLFNAASLASLEDEITQNAKPLALL